MLGLSMTPPKAQVGEENVCLQLCGLCYIMVELQMGAWSALSCVFDGHLSKTTTKRLLTFFLYGPFLGFPSPLPL